MGLRAKMKKLTKENKRLSEQNKILRARIKELNIYNRFDILDIDDVKKDEVEIDSCGL